MKQITKEEFNKMFPLKYREMWANNYGRVSYTNEPKIFTKYIRNKFWKLLQKELIK